MARLVLTLTVDYDLNGVSIQELTNLIKDNIGWMIGDGGLTGDTPAEVDGWSIRTEHTIYPEDKVNG